MYVFSYKYLHYYALNLGVPFRLSQTTCRFVGTCNYNTILTRILQVKSPTSWGWFYTSIEVDLRLFSMLNRLRFYALKYRQFEAELKLIRSQVVERNVFWRWSKCRFERKNDRQIDIDLIAGCLRLSESSKVILFSL